MYQPACRRCAGLLGCALPRSTVRTPILTQRLSRRHDSTAAVESSPAGSANDADIASLSGDRASQRPSAESEQGRSRGKAHSQFQTHAGLIVSRPPVITRELSAFETAYYAYQRHLKAKLVSPFPLDFYFAKGSPAAKRWTAGEAARQEALSLDHLLQHDDAAANEAPAAASIEVAGRSKELTTEERELQDEANVAKSLALPRRTKADDANDVTSLDRALDRTLYLLVRRASSAASESDSDAEDGWRFPQTPVGQGELLHDAAERGFEQACGRDLKRWLVARHPVGHMTYAYATDRVGYPGAKVYFLKARALAGQAKTNSSDNASAAEFAWLTKEEVQQRVGEAYWKAIAPMLPSV